LRPFWGQPQIEFATILFISNAFDRAALEHCGYGTADGDLWVSLLRCRDECALQAWREPSVADDAHSGRRFGRLAIFVASAALTSRQGGLAETA